MARCETKFDLNFVRYAQSSKCKTDKDSSVSYASAVVRHADAAKDQVGSEAKKGARNNVRPSEP
jgi:hypothetical protein